MSKRVAIGSRPTTRKTDQSTANADAWVDNQRSATEPEPLKRLTIDLPESLHRRIKVQCAIEGTTIVDVVRGLLAERFPANN